MAARSLDELLESSRVRDVFYDPRSGWDRDAQRAIHESCTRPIPLDQVSERKGPGNQNVYYVDGGKVISLANECFKFNGWNNEIRSMNTDYCYDDKRGSNVGITCIMRVTLADGSFHEDVGFGAATARGKSEALMQAKKSAVTDALKRTMRLFGDGLGNCVSQNKMKSVQELKRAVKATTREVAGTGTGVAGSGRVGGVGSGAMGVGVGAAAVVALAASHSVQGHSAALRASAAAAPGAGGDSAGNGQLRKGDAAGVPVVAGAMTSYNYNAGPPTGCFETGGKAAMLLLDAGGVGVGSAAVDDPSDVAIAHLAAPEPPRWSDGTDVHRAATVLPPLSRDSGGRMVEPLCPSVSLVAAAAPCIGGGGGVGIGAGGACVVAGGSISSAMAAVSLAAEASAAGGVVPSSGGSPPHPVPPESTPPQRQAAVQAPAPASVAPPPPAPSRDTSEEEKRRQEARRRLQAGQQQQQQQQQQLQQQLQQQHRVVPRPAMPAMTGAARPPAQAMGGATARPQMAPTGARPVAAASAVSAPAVGVAAPRATAPAPQARPWSAGASPDHGRQEKRQRVGDA